MLTQLRHLCLLTHQCCCTHAHTPALVVLPKSKPVCTQVIRNTHNLLMRHRNTHSPHVLPQSLNTPRRHHHGLTYRAWPMAPDRTISVTETRTSMKARMGKGERLLSTEPHPNYYSASAGVARPHPRLPPLPIFRALDAHPKDKAAVQDYPHQDESKMEDRAGTATAAATECRKQNHTYGDLLQDISLAQQRLIELVGSKSSCLTEKKAADIDGARVAFWIPNSSGYQWTSTLFAIWAAGGVAVPLCATHPAKEVAYVLQDSGAEWVFYAREGVEVIEEAARMVLRDNGKEVKVSPVETLFPSAARKGVGLGEVEGDGMNKKEILDADGDLNWWLSRRALIIYTSGTTSLPKGVVSTHLNIYAQMTSLATAWEYNPTDYLLHVLPLHHVHGILNCTLVPLFRGGTVEFLSLPFKADRVLRRLAQPFLSPLQGKDIFNPITLFMAVPAIYTRLIDTYHGGSMEADVQKAVTKALSQLRLTVSGSAALPSSVRNAWAKISGGGWLLERYGMTEIGMAVSCGIGPRGDIERPEGAVGWALPGYEVGLRWVNTEDSNTPTAMEGEILVRGPGVFAEYWNRPRDVTEKEFLPQSYIPEISHLKPSQHGNPFPPLPALHSTPNSNKVSSSPPVITTSPSSFPWFRTGDFARLSWPHSHPHPSSPGPSNPVGPPDTQPQPPLTILGRLSTDILKSGGEKLSALEIEREILLTGLASEVAVVGLPSQKWGDLVAAVVAPIPVAALNTGPMSEVGGEGCQREEGQEEAELGLQKRLKEALKERGVAGYKIPKVVVRVEGLARNAMGKVDKKGLVKRLVEERGWDAQRGNWRGGKDR